MKKYLLIPAIAFMLAGCTGGNGGGTGGGTGGGGSTGGNTVLAKYDFTSVVGQGDALEDAATATQLFNSCKTAGNGSVTVTNVNKTYKGNGKGGVHANKGGFVKLGTGSVNGTLEFTASQKVSKATVNCHAFYASSDSYPNNTTNYFAVNDGTAIAAPYNATGTGENVDFTINGTTVKISTSNPAPTETVTAGRIYIFSITLYA